MASSSMRAALGLRLAHVPMTPETEFYAGDLTMQFTAAAVLLLAQDGKLKLDDPVSKYVPNVSAGRRHHDRPAADADLRSAELHRGAWGFARTTLARSNSPISWRRSMI